MVERMNEKGEGTKECGDQTECADGWMGRLFGS